MLRQDLKSVRHPLYPAIYQLLAWHQAGAQSLLQLFMCVWQIQLPAIRPAVLQLNQQELFLKMFQSAELLTLYHCQALQELLQFVQTLQGIYIPANQE